MTPRECEYRALLEEIRSYCRVRVKLSLADKAFPFFIDRITKALAEPVEDKDEVA